MALSLDTWLQPHLFSPITFVPWRASDWLVWVACLFLSLLGWGGQSPENAAPREALEAEEHL